MSFRAFRGRSVAVSVTAMVVSMLAVVFLVDHVRAAGVVLVAAVVGLAAVLTLDPGSGESRDTRSLGRLLRGTGLAIGVGLVGFTLGLVLVTLSRN